MMMRKVSFAATVALITGLLFSPHLVQAQAAAEALPTEMDVVQAVVSDGRDPGPGAFAEYAGRLEAEDATGVSGHVRIGIAWQLAGVRDAAYRQFAAAVAVEPENVTLYPRLSSTAPAGITVFAEGRAVSFPDAQPQIVDGRTLVPFRAIAEALGADVAWDADTKTASIRLGDREVHLTQDSTLALIGLNPKLLDVPAAVVPPGRFAVPLRFVGEALGFKVQWFEITPGTAVIGIYHESSGGTN